MWPSPLASSFGSRRLRHRGRCRGRSRRTSTASPSRSLFSIGSRPSAPPALLTSTRHSPIAAQKSSTDASSVTSRGDRPRARSVGDLAEPIEASRADDDVEAFLRQMPRGRRADAAARARDDRDPPVQGPDPTGRRCSRRLRLCCRRLRRARFGRLVRRRRLGGRWQRLDLVLHLHEAARSHPGPALGRPGS